MSALTDTRRAWEGFQVGSPATSARAEIVTSWQRSQDHGVDPGRLDLAREAIDLSSQLLRAGAPVLLDMADLLTGTCTSLALADAAGTLMWRWESETTLSRDLDRIEFEPGSLVGELTAGTNAIGVTTQTKRPSIVIGAEHYKEPWHAWACVAAPIVHPITRQNMGAVNVACRAEDANHLLLVAVRSLAKGVETALGEARTAHQRRLVEAHQRFRSAVNAPVVTIDQHTMILDDDASRLRLQREQLWSILTEAGPRAMDVAVGDGLRASVHPVGPNWLLDGVVLLIRKSRPEPTTNVLGLEPVRNLSPLEQSELEVISQMLAACNGKKTEVAARLGISRGTLYQRLRRYRLA